MPQGTTGEVFGSGGIYLGQAATSYQDSGGNNLGGAPVNAGTYTAIGTFAGDDTYAAATGTATVTIEKATPTVSIFTGEVIYDGTPQVTTGEVYGVGGEDLGPAAISYPGGSAPVDAGTYTITGSFGGNANYTSTSDTGALTIGPATPTVVMAPYSASYSGQAQGTTGPYYGLNGTVMGEVYGVDGTLLGPATTVAFNGGGAPTDVGTYTVTGQFNPAGQNDYTSASGAGIFTITKSLPWIRILAAGGTYTGSPIAATVQMQGNTWLDSNWSAALESVHPAITYYDADGNKLSGAPMDPGNYTVGVSFPGSTDYYPRGASATFSISRTIPPLSIQDANTYRLKNVQNDSLEGVSATFTYYDTNGTRWTGDGEPTATGNYFAVASFNGSDTTDYASTISLPYFFTVGSTPSNHPTVQVSIAGNTVFTGNPIAATATVNGQASLENVTPSLMYFDFNGRPLTGRLPGRKTMSW